MQQMKGNHVHPLERAQVMCALVANDPAKQNWLRSAGLLQVLHRLTLGVQLPSSDVSDDVSSALGHDVSLSVRRQCARILAIVAQQQDALVGRLHCSYFIASWIMFAMIFVTSASHLLLNTWTLRAVGAAAS